MICSKFFPFFSMHFLSLRTKLAITLWHCSIGILCVASEITAFSSTVLPNVFPRSSSFKKPQRWKSRGLKSGLLGLQGRSVRLLITLSAKCLLIQSRETPETWTLAPSCWNHWFWRRLDRKSLPEISKSDQQQQHSARCWLLLFLRQFQRKKGQWCRAYSSQPTQWPSCHGATFLKLRLASDFPRIQSPCCLHDHSNKNVPSLKTRCCLRSCHSAQFLAIPFMFVVDQFSLMFLLREQINKFIR